MSKSKESSWNLVWWLMLFAFLEDKLKEKND